MRGGMFILLNLLFINVFAQDTAYLSHNFSALGINPSSVEIWEDGTRTNGGKSGTYEWWYFDFKLSDGTTMVIDFLTKPITGINKASRPFFFVEINFPDGRKYARAWNYKATEAFFSSDSCYVRMGQSFVHGNLKNYTIHIDEKDFKLDLKLHNTAVSWRPQTGHLFFGKDKFFAWLVAVPRGNVKVNFSIDKTTYNLTGKGYHDHNWGNYPMYKLIHHWYWSRTQFDNYTVIAADVVANSHYGYKDFVLFAVFRDGQLLTHSTDSVQFYQSVPNPIPPHKLLSSHLLFRYSNNTNTYELQLDQKQIISTVRLAETVISFKPLARILESLFGFNATYYRMTGQGKFILIKNGCLKQKLSTDNAIWELMYFGKPGK